MRRSPEHRTFVCTPCRYKDRDCRPGHELITRLREAISTVSTAVSDECEISGIACMTGYDRPCTEAYHGTQKATYLHGNIDPNEDIQALVSFTEQYRLLQDGWFNAKYRPQKLRQSTLARVPAAKMKIVSETTETTVS